MSFLLLCWDGGREGGRELIEAGHRTRKCVLRDLWGCGGGVSAQHYDLWIMQGAEEYSGHWWGGRSFGLVEEYHLEKNVFWITCISLILMMMIFPSLRSIYSACRCCLTNASTSLRAKSISHHNAAFHLIQSFLTVINTSHICRFHSTCMSACVRKLRRIWLMLTNYTTVTILLHSVWLMCTSVCYRRMFFTPFHPTCSHSHVSSYLQGGGTVSNQICIPQNQNLNDIVVQISMSNNMKKSQTWGTNNNFQYQIVQQYCARLVSSTSDTEKVLFLQYSLIKPQNILKYSEVSYELLNITLEIIQYVLLPCTCIQ